MNNNYLDKNIYALNELKKLDSIYTKLLEDIIDCFNNNHRLFLIGNGGSAADCSHCAGDFKYIVDNKPKFFNVLALTDSSSLITAIANDYSFNDIFKMQLETLGTSGDIVIGITTSGKSTNVLKALDYAKSINIKTCLITGEKNIFNYDNVVNISSNDTTVIQNVYKVFLHMLAKDVGDYFENRN